MKYLLLFIITISSLTFAQEFKITKVIDNNIFQLKNGQLVQLAEVYVPSIKDPNDTVRALAISINKWANSILTGHDYLIKFITNDSLPKIRIFRSHLGVGEDIIEKYILFGFAIFTGDTNSTKYIDYMEDQNTAQKNKKGIWSLDPENLSKLRNGIVFTPITIIPNELESKLNLKGLSPESHIKTERPYLPLLAVSVASFALAWDYFATASDYQNIIDKTNPQLSDLKSRLSHTHDDVTRTAINQSIKEAQDVINEAQKTHTRKIILGVSCIAAGIVTTIFAFKEVQVKTDLQSLTLSYRF
jgi:endonuclease YncB( thermonuclease family)